MAFYNKTGDVGSFLQIASDIDTQLKAGGLMDMQQDLVENMLGFETINETARGTVIQAEDTAMEYLRGQGLDQKLATHLGLESVDHPCVERGMEAAAMTLMAAHQPDVWHEKFSSKYEAPENVRSLHDPFEQAFSMEGYDNFVFEGFMGVSVVANALAAASSPFSETFFRTVILSANQSGLDVELSNVAIYSRKPRANTGAAYDLERKSATRAMIDHTILENNATDIVPVVRAGGETDPVLVPASDIPTFKRTVGGLEINTRPIAYGKKVDLMGVSLADELLASNEQDETDTLDPAVDLGEHFLSFQHSNGTTNPVGVASYVLSDMRGALLMPVAEDNIRDLATTFTGKLLLESSTVLIDKTDAETALELGAVLAVPAGGRWRVELTLDLTGKVEFTNSNMVVYSNAVAITGAYVAADANADFVAVDKDSAEYAALLTKLVITPKGYIPGAKRSNSNMSTMGHIIDMTDIVRARIPVKMQSPLTLVMPSSTKGNGVTMDAMNMIRRAVGTNQAVTELLKAETQLKNTAAIPYGSPIIGAVAGIVPTYIYRKLDVSDKTNIFGSSQAMEDLRGAINAAVTTVTQQLLLDSGYLASLEQFTNTTANFEVILGTDQQIESLLMVSGDNRTLGNNRNYKISSTPDQRIRGRIYISVRRTDVEGADAHSFGVHPLAPALLHQATVTRSNRVSKEIQMVPRENFRVTTPVLARIDIIGLDTMFVSE